MSVPNFEDFAHVWCPAGGGLGLRSARRTQPAAYWASWADAIKMVQERHPGVARTILAALEENSEAESIQAITVCARTLQGVGFESPSWAELAEGQAPGGVEEEDPCQRLGWQQQASNALERHHHDHAVWPRLREHERAMMRSQRGPLARTPFVSFPSDRISRFDPAPFRALLRRLLLPLPLSVRSCRCGRPLGAWPPLCSMRNSRGVRAQRLGTGVSSKSLP